MSVKRVIMNGLVRLFYSLPDAIVAVSRGMADDVSRVERIPRRRIRVIYNPFDVAQLIAKSKDSLEHPWFEGDAPPVILAMSGLTRQKDFRTPIESFKLVREERAILATVVHRLFESGSDRQGMRFLRDVYVPGTDELELHYVYRAMAWLGEHKEEVEERLFATGRDLFTELQLAFFDKTSSYFEGKAGEQLRQCGHSKDHRPDGHQMVVGALPTQKVRSLNREVWPGNRSDAKALLLKVDRVLERFGIKQVCFVADRGMVSERVIEDLKKREMEHILGMRLRWVKEVQNQVLSHPGRYLRVVDNLQVKEVRIEGRRYMVCLNPEQAKRDAAERAVILEALEEKLKQGTKALVGNRGFRRCLVAERGAIRIEHHKVTAEGRYDGKWVVRTNTTLPTAAVAQQYKHLLTVERFFRCAKSLLDTRPIFHKVDTTITGHIFCSFLALLLMHELQEWVKKRGDHLEWAGISRSLEALGKVEVRHQGKLYSVHTPLEDVCGKVLQVVGVAIPPQVRKVGFHNAKAS
jgi:transposase